MKTTHMPARKLLRQLVGAPGFEPGASCAQGRRANTLSQLGTHRGQEKGKMGMPESC
jgi:hypothetical protein